MRLFFFCVLLITNSLTAATFRRGQSCQHSLLSALIPEKISFEGDVFNDREIAALRVHLKAAVAALNLDIGQKIPASVLPNQEVFTFLPQFDRPSLVAPEFADVTAAKYRAEKLLAFLDMGTNEVSSRQKLFVYRGQADINNFIKRSFSNFVTSRAKRGGALLMKYSFSMVFLALPTWGAIGIAFAELPIRGLQDLTAAACILVETPPLGTYRVYEQI